VLIALGAALEKVPGEPGAQRLVFSRAGANWAPGPYWYLIRNGAITFVGSLLTLFDAGDYAVMAYPRFCSGRRAKATPEMDSSFFARAMDRSTNSTYLGPTATEHLTQSGRPLPSEAVKKSQISRLRSRF
jgi:hypothetical protein